MSDCKGCKFEGGGSVGIGPCHDCLRNKIDNYELPEIDEPVSAEEWARKHCSGGSNITAISYEELRKMFEHAFEEGEENQKKRYRETQTFEEWLSRYRSKPRWQAAGPYVMMMDAWEACKKAHNLED